MKVVQIKSILLSKVINSLYVLLHDGRGPSTTSKEGQTQRHIGPTTRAMAKRLDEDWDTATDGRETYLYMFQEVQNQA